MVIFGKGHEFGLLLIRITDSTLNRRGRLSFIDIPNNATDGKQVNGLPLNVTELAEVKRHSLSSIFGDSG